VSKTAQDTPNAWRTGWKRNGETFRVGNFQLDEVNAEGIIAGCHNIKWDAIEDLAKREGVLK